MGFLDFLFGGSEEAQLKRHAKKVVNLNSQLEERQASAQWLATNGTEEAIGALLKRFALTYEQRMKDADEKQHFLKVLASIGPSVVDPTKEWIQKNTNFAIPLQLIEQFEGKDSTVEILLLLLGQEIDPFKPEKKRQILIHLAKYQDQRILERAPACLQDFDEGVRYAAVEALAAQQVDGIIEELIEALANPEEESNRFRVRIAEICLNRQWPLGEHGDYIGDNPPTGYAVKNNLIYRV